MFDSQQAALEFLKRKQVVPTSDYQEIWGRNHAFAFTIAQALRFDIVAATKQTLVTALEQGWSERKTRQVMSEVHKRMGVTTANPWRLQTIYRTNMQAAYQAGRWNAMWAMRDDRPWLQYVAVMDGSTRETHAALNGKIARVTDSIWREIYPPNGFNCRCRVRALTNAQAKGKKRIRKLPTGFPDSGFDYNPALAQAEALGRKINASTARLGPDAGKLAALFIAQFPTEAAPLVPLAWIGEYVWSRSTELKPLFDKAETITREGRKLRLTARGRKAVFVNVKVQHGVLIATKASRGANKWLSD